MDGDRNSFHNDVFNNNPPTDDVRQRASNNRVKRDVTHPLHNPGWIYAQLFNRGACEKKTREISQGLRSHFRLKVIGISTFTFCFHSVPYAATPPRALR